MIVEMSLDNASSVERELREGHEIQMTLKTFCWNKNHSQTKGTGLSPRKEMLSKP